MSFIHVTSIINILFVDIGLLLLLVVDMSKHKVVLINLISDIQFDFVDSDNNACVALLSSVLRGYMLAECVCLGLSMFSCF